MSVSVDLANLREEIDRHGLVAFFLSVGPEGRPHSVQLRVEWLEPGRLVVHPGNSTVANAAARPLVSLLWPPTEPGGYSLIVDGRAVDASGSGQGDNTVSVEPTKAVLHRPAQPDDGDAATHGSDCVRVFSAKA
jgi:hypothetical protein